MSDEEFINSFMEVRPQELNIRDVFARLALAWKLRGATTEEFAAYVRSARISVNKSSINEWIGKLKSHGSTTLVSSKKSETKVLDRVEIQVLVGWVLAQNRKKKVVKYNSVVLKAKEMFEVTIGYETIRNYMENHGISYKKLISHGPDLVATMEEVYENVKLFATQMRLTGYLDGEVDKKDVICLDYIHDSHWNHVDKGLGPTSASDKGQMMVSPFTSTFLVGNSLAGKVLPPIMFTLNPLFKKNGRNLEHFSPQHLELMDDCGIKPWQFVFLEDIQETKPGQKFAGETKSMTICGIQLWRKNVAWYKSTETKIFITDCGNSFRLEKESILKFLGCDQHIRLIPICHHLQSTCDNGTNLKTKTAWRKGAALLPKNHQTQPEDAFNLMRAAKNFKKGEIKEAWIKNMLLDVPDIENFTFHDFKLRFNHSSEKWSELHRQCEQQYKNFTAHDQRGQR